MGYYSEVYLLLKEKEHVYVQRRLAELVNLQNESDTFIDDFLWKLKISSFKKDEEDYYLYMWDYIKWYVGDMKNYPVVYTIEDCMNKFKEEDYFFLRAGEDWFDMETKGCLSYYFFPCKEIFASVFNYDDCK